MLTSEALSHQRGYLLPTEVAALKELADSLPPFPSAVNVGAGVGTSGLALMEARKDLRLYSVDNVQASLDAEQEAFGRAGMKSIIRYIQMLGDSHEIASAWLGRGFRPVHLIFIDDGHTYPEVAGDIEKWLPNLTPGGIMGFHDYRNNWDIGVGQAVDEGMAGQQQIMLVEGLIAFKVLS